MKSKFLAMMVGVALSAASGIACAQFGGMKLPRPNWLARI